MHMVRIESHLGEGASLPHLSDGDFGARNDCSVLESSLRKLYVEQPNMNTIDFNAIRPGDNFQDGGDVTGDINEVLFVVIFSCIGFIATFVLLLAVFVILRRKMGFRALEDEETGRNIANRVYTELDAEEQELYFQSVQFFESNPYLRYEIPLSQLLSIQEKGIQAFEFRKDPMLTNNDLLIVNKYELNFFKNLECSAQTNIPIPMINDIYYFEAKIYLLPDPDDTLISVGLAPKPYPWFRLPGRHPYSISYDSTGYRKHNDPFPAEGPPPFPSLIQGDVIGIGYRVRSGTVFFTKNGKKVSELAIGGHIKKFKLPQQGHIFPTVGANNLCSVHLNLGQMGFVYIEANVKKWGLAPLEGNGPSPPAYNKFNLDILLERSEYDESESERENDFPPYFWDVANSRRDGAVPGHIAANQSYDAYRDEDEAMGDRITLASLLPPEDPPSYGEENEGEQEPEEDNGDTNNADEDEVEDSEITRTESDLVPEQEHSENVGEDDNDIKNKNKNKNKNTNGIDDNNVPYGNNMSDTPTVDEENSAGSSQDIPGTTDEALEERHNTESDGSPDALVENQEQEQTQEEQSLHTDNSPQQIPLSSPAGTDDTQ